jgi:hypothetical protein
MRRANKILALFLILSSAAILAEGARIWDGMGGTGFMPVLVGILFAILGVSLFWAAGHPEDRQLISWPGKDTRGKLVLVFSALPVYAIAMPWIGYPVATFLFLAGLIRVLGERRWWCGLIFGTIVSGITYFVFKVCLHMPFPGGIWGS